MRLPLISPIFSFVASGVAGATLGADPREALLADPDRLAAIRASAERHGIALRDSRAFNLALIDWANAIRRPDLDERAGVPADLLSRQPMPIATADGSLLALSLLPTDFERGRKNLVMTAIGSAVAGTVAGFSGPAGVLPLGLLAFLYFAGKRRAMLEVQGKEFNGDASRPASLLLDQRRRQNIDAMRDTTPFLVLGRATGWLRRVNDLCCPDPGQEIGLTCGDMSRHLWIWGATGSGKTSGLMRPLARQWSQKTRDGLLVLDGKGDLPREFVGAIANYTLIEPGFSKVALLEGLSPEDVVVALSGHVQEASGAAEFWSESGKVFLFHVANVLSARVAQGLDRWTVSRLSELVSSIGALKALLSQYDGVPLEDWIANSAAYLTEFAYDMPTDTAGSIRATAQSWLAPLMLSRELADWTNCAPGEASVTVTNVLRGARMGVSLPEFKFGVAGLAASRLIRATLYRSVKLRGSFDRWEAGERHALLLMDEAALALSHAETAIAPIARSLGLAMCCAAQSFEQIATQFKGELGARALLDQFRSQVMFESSRATLAYVSERGGHALAPARNRQIYDGTILRDLRAASDAYRGLGSVGQALHQTALSGSGPKGAEDGRTNAMNGYQLCNPLEQPLPLASARAIAVLTRAGAPRRDVIDAQQEFFNAAA